MNKAAIIF